MDQNAAVAQWISVASASKYSGGSYIGSAFRKADVEKEPAVSYYVMGDTATSGAPGNDWPIPAK